MQEDSQADGQSSTSAFAAATTSANRPQIWSSKLEATDRVSEAEPLYRRALQIYESSYGPDDPRVAIVLNNLAGVLKATNCVSEAESLYLRALQISEATHVPGHPTVAIGLNNLASILIATNRLSEAEPLLRRALSILGQFQIQTGHEHPHFRAVKRSYEPFLGTQGLSTTSSG